MTGDQEESFRALYLEHFDALLGYALRRVTAADEAADVVAETFLVAWRRSGDVPAGPETRLWLYGVARRVLANHLRGERRRDRLGGRLREQLADTALASVHSGAVAVDEVVTSALSRLTRTDRELLTLVAWEGLAPREIAEVLGMSAGVVRTRLSRARTRLRTELAAVGRIESGVAGLELHQGTASSKEAR